MKVYEFIPQLAHRIVDQAIHYEFIHTSVQSSDKSTGL